MLGGGSGGQGFDEDPCSFAVDGFLEVPCEAWIATKPCQAALDYPSAGEHLEALRGLGAADDFDGPFAEIGEGDFQFSARVCAVGNEMAQPAIEIPNVSDQRDVTVAVLDVGAVDDHREQQAHRVDEDMPFAAFHLFARVIAARAAALGGLYRSAVDDAGGGEID